MSAETIYITVTQRTSIGMNLSETRMVDIGQLDSARMPEVFLYHEFRLARNAARARAKKLEAKQKPKVPA